MLKLWWHRFKTKRIEIRLVHYSDAEVLLKNGWELAKEEDTNTSYGFVYLERRIPKTKGRIVNE